MRLGRAEAGVTVGALPVTGETGPPAGSKGPLLAAPDALEDRRGGGLPLVVAVHAFTCPKRVTS